MKEIDDSVDRIVAGMEGTPMVDSKSKSLVAYHEVGHAVCGTLTPGGHSGDVAPDFFGMFTPLSSCLMRQLVQIAPHVHATQSLTQASNDGPQLQGPLPLLCSRAGACRGV